MEINETSLIVFYVSRIFGYAPYRLQLNQPGKLRQIFSSVVLKCYSCGLLITLVSLTICGLVQDANADIPLRMKSNTSKVVTSFDVNVVAMSCLCGVLAGSIGLRQTQEVNCRLKEADDILCIYVGQNNKSKKRGNKLVFVILTAILSILALDIYGWYRQAVNIKRKNASAVNIVNNLYWYMPFYTMYVFLMTLQIQFAHTSWGLALRYRHLNFALKNIFLKDNSFFHKKNVGFTTATINEHHKNENVTSVVRRDRSMSLRNTYLMQLAYIHESLGKTLICISSYFGFTILMLLLSCLLHLIATAYFLILSLMVDSKELEPFHICLQFIWLMFHSFRLLLIVEPCNMTSIESSQTLHLVCNIMRGRPNSVVLESFWQQLLADETYFTACGICKIDRSILTTLLAAITTYLVILLQFENIYGS